MRKTVKVTCLYHAGQHFKVKNVTISATAFRSLTVVNNIFLFCYHFLSDLVFYYFIISIMVVDDEDWMYASQQHHVSAIHGGIHDMVPCVGLF